MTSSVGCYFNSAKYFLLFLIADQSAPVMPLTKQTRTISVGSNVTIACHVEASNPPPTISWSKRGGQLPRYALDT